MTQTFDLAIDARVRSTGHILAHQWSAKLDDREPTIASFVQQALSLYGVVTLEFWVTAAHESVSVDAYLQVREITDLYRTEREHVVLRDLREPTEYRPPATDTEQTRKVAVNVGTNFYKRGR